MIELLTLLTNKDKYYRFKPFIKDHVLPKEAKQIVADYDEYYQAHPSFDDIDIDQFSVWFTVMKHSSYKPATMEIYHEIFSKIKAYFNKRTGLKQEDDKGIEHVLKFKNNRKNQKSEVSKFEQEQSIYKKNPILSEFYERYGDIKKKPNKKYHRKEQVEKEEINLLMEDLKTWKTEDM